MAAAVSCEARVLFGVSEQGYPVLHLLFSGWQNQDLSWSPQFGGGIGFRGRVCHYPCHLFSSPHPVLISPALPHPKKPLQQLATNLTAAVPMALLDSNAQLVWWLILASASADFCISTLLMYWWKQHAWQHACNSHCRGSRLIGGTALALDQAIRMYIQWCLA